MYISIKGGGGGGCDCHCARYYVRVANFYASLLCVPPVCIYLQIYTCVRGCKRARRRARGSPWRLSFALDGSLIDARSGAKEAARVPFPQGKGVNTGGYRFLFVIYLTFLLSVWVYRDIVVEGMIFGLIFISVRDE